MSKPKEEYEDPEEEYYEEEEYEDPEEEYYEEEEYEDPDPSAPETSKSPAPTTYTPFESEPVPGENPWKPVKNKSGHVLYYIHKKTLQTTAPGAPRPPNPSKIVTVESGNKYYQNMDTHELVKINPSVPEKPNQFQSAKHLAKNFVYNSTIGELRNARVPILSTVARTVYRKLLSNEGKPVFDTKENYYKLGGKRTRKAKKSSSKKRKTSHRKGTKNAIKTSSKRTRKDN